MSHYQNLKRCGHKELQQFMIVSRYQIFDRLNISKQLVVILVKYVLITFVKFVSITENYIFRMFQVSMNKIKFYVIPSYILAVPV